MPVAHAFSGCDTVAQCWGVGKAKVVKVLQSHKLLTQLENPAGSPSNIVPECASFMCACYGYTHVDTKTQERCMAWKNKTAKSNIVSAPKLMSLPPTSEAFEQNVLRAHLQACIWKTALEGNPLSLDSTKYGW